MDYEGYTFVFFIKTINKFFFHLNVIYIFFYFLSVEKYFKMQVTYICFN